MFDRIFDRLVEWGGRLVPVVVVDEFEEGVVFTLGRVTRKIRSDDGWRISRWPARLSSPTGLHLLVPILERAVKVNIATDTLNLRTQTLTTRDGHTIGIGAVVTYRIRDVYKFIVCAESAEKVLADSSYGTIGRLVAEGDWSATHREEFRERVQREVREKANQFGIRVDNLSFSDLAPCPAYRVLMDHVAISLTNRNGGDGE